MQRLIDPFSTFVSRFIATVVLLGPLATALGGWLCAADLPSRIRDTDIKDIAELEKMTTDEIRKIVITKAIEEMETSDIALTKAVYTARLGTNIQFDPDWRSFVVAKQFYTQDAAMEAVLHIAEPNAVAFSGVLAEPHCTAVGSKENGYWVLLNADFRAVFPGKEQRDGIAAAITKDDKWRPREPKPGAGTSTRRPEAMLSAVPGNAHGSPIGKARETYAAAFRKFKGDVLAAVMIRARVVGKNENKEAGTDLEIRASFDREDGASEGNDGVAIELERNPSILGARFFARKGRPLRNVALSHWSGRSWGAREIRLWPRHRLGHRQFAGRGLPQAATGWPDYPSESRGNGMPVELDQGLGPM